MPERQAKTLADERWKRSAIQGKKRARLKWRPRTALGRPSEPEVKPRLGVESGPTRTSGGVAALARMLSKMSVPSTSPPKRAPLSLRRRLGIWVLMASSSSMYFWTRGARFLFG